MNAYRYGISGKVNKAGDWYLRRDALPLRSLTYLVM